MENRIMGCEKAKFTLNRAGRFMENKRKYGTNRKHKTRWQKWINICIVSSTLLIKGIDCEKLIKLLYIRDIVKIEGHERQVTHEWLEKSISGKNQLR